MPLGRRGHNLLGVVMGREDGGTVSRRACELRVTGPSSGLALKIQLQRELQGHRGCVNTCSFHPDGARLLTGSDDQRVIIWDWQRGTPVEAWTSGHSHNIFQAKAVGVGSQAVVTAAADGQVRLHLLNSSGHVKSCKIGAHQGQKCHKLALDPQQPHCFYSAGEDGSVRHYDIRLRKAGSQKGGQVVDLYGIAVDPSQPDVLAVGGDEEYVHLYDARRLCHRSPDSSNPLGVLSAAPVAHFCPSALRGSSQRQSRVHITAVAFSRRGELLATYNDADVYLFRPRDGGREPAAPVAAADGKGDRKTTPEEARRACSKRFGFHPR